ncbi:hypothetical protein HDV06_002963 [Boothiomyces sp. JEL0866]|nr:hypothetical protein HDV06_002963 [Boothiomyces sp. JEL0866]
MNSFLQGVCDFNVLIIGCNHLDIVKAVNTGSVLLHIVSIIFGSVYPVTRITKDIKTKTVSVTFHRELLFWATFLNIFYHVLLTAKYIVLNTMTPGMDDDSIIQGTRVALSLEYISLAMAGIIMTCLTTHFIQGAVGANQSLYSLFGKEFNPMHAIKFIRISIFLYSLTLFVLWIHFGLQNWQYFVLFRRVIYYSYAIISLLLSSTIYNYFLTKIIVKLTERMKEDGEEIPESLKLLTLLKDIYTRSYAFSAAISMLLKVVANDYFSSFIIPWQIVSNLTIHYSSTVLTFYSVYKSSPSSLKKLKKKMYSKEKTKTNVSANCEKLKDVYIAPTFIRDINLWNDALFWSTILNFVVQSITAVKYYLMNTISPNSDYETILRNVKLSISLEYISLALAGIGMTVLISHFIEGALGSNQSIYTLFGQDYNPVKVLKGVRLFIFIYTLVLYVLWIEIGLKSVYYYQLFRSIIYYSYTVITGVIAPIMYSYFISKVIQKLRDKFESSGEDAPPSLNYLILFNKILTRSYTFAVATSMFIKAFGNQYFSNYIIPWQATSNILLTYGSTVLVLYALYRSFPTTVYKIRVKLASRSDLGVKLRPSVADLKSKTMAPPVNTLVIQKP